MVSGDLSTPSKRPWPFLAIMVLLAPHLVGIFFLFPRYAFTEGDADLKIFSVAVALFTLLTFAGLWLNKPWALWASLVVVSLKATIDLFAWAVDFDRTWTAVGALLLAAVAVLAFREAVPPTSKVGAYQRILFGCVLAFAAWVAFWGLFLPAQIGIALPLSAPPLHARFLGAMYLAGATFMLLGLLARHWHEARVVTVILALWTGGLGLVSVLHLDVFRWSQGATWFWFVAYIGFPLLAAWIAWCQRKETAHPDEREISGGLRIYLYVQGAIMLVLGLLLLIVPAYMTTVWPWGISVVLAQIYGSPFLAYGVGSLYAARQRAWSEVRIAVSGTLVFVLGVLGASVLHAATFNPSAPSVWLWFGCLGIAGLAMLLFFALPSLRTAKAT